MFKYIIILLLTLAMAIPAISQEQATFHIKTFWLAESINWGGVVIDGQMSVYGTSHGCSRETNPMFALDEGTRFNAGKYYTVNIPISAVLTTVHILTYKYSHNKIARRVTDIISAGNGIPHIYQGIKWIGFCN